MKNDYDMIDYVNQLREGILEAYVGIVQGLKSGNCGKYIYIWFFINFILFYFIYLLLFYKEWLWYDWLC